jgi:hypothetical protein
MTDYNDLFGRAHKRETLDIMVRKQASVLEIECSGQLTYAQQAAACRQSSPQAFNLFLAAHNRHQKLEEKEDALLCPSDLF